MTASLLPSSSLNAAMTAAKSHLFELVAGFEIAGIKVSQEPRVKITYHLPADWHGPEEYDEEIVGMDIRFEFGDAFTFDDVCAAADVLTCAFQIDGSSIVVPKEALK